MARHSSATASDPNPGYRENFRGRVAAVAGILVVGFVLAVMTFWLLDRFERDRARFIFDQTAADRLVAVEQSIEFNIEVIRAVVGFYESSSFVDRSEFSSFASPALFRRRSFQALAWVPRILDGERAAMVEKGRADGFSDFDIKERTADGSVVPASQRPEYFPIYYVEPLLGNERGLGIDLTSEPDLRRVLSSARDSGEITATGRAATERGGLGREGIFVFAPVYEIGKPLDGVEFRRQFLRGFVLGLMRVGDAVNYAIEERVSSGLQRLPRIDFYLFDSTPGVQSQLLHIRPAFGGHNTAPVLTLDGALEGTNLARTFSVGGRELVAVARPSNGQLFDGLIWQPWVAALIVFSFAPLFAWFLNVVVKRREFAENLVVDRTRELRDSEQALVEKAELLTLLHSIADAANQAASLEEVIQFCLDRICGFTGWPIGHAFLRKHEGSIELESAGLWHVNERQDFSEFQEVSMNGRFVVGEALPGLVIATGKPRWLMGQYGRSNPARAKVADAHGLNAGFGLPIMVGNRAIGALEFFTDQKEEPNEDLIQAWMQIGTQLGRVAERMTVDRMKSDFVSTVSHELRTPLTSIQGSLGLMRGGVFGGLPDDLEKMVEIAYSNSDRLVRLINDILDIEKIESGKMEYVFENESIADIVKESIEANKLYADQFGVGFRTAQNIPAATVRGDKDRLAQVMANLLSNAAKFSPAGSEVVVEGVETEESVRINVSDKGPGIDEAFRSRIFSKFAQADSSDTRSKGGTGLGLNISKAIIDHHGGEIGYETIVGEGSTFYFVLPKASTSKPGLSMSDEQNA